MHKKLTVSVFLVCSACSQNDADLTFAELEAAGFEDVEVYTFDDPDLENAPFYESIKTEDPGSTWADKCVHKNVILLSKGYQACDRLYEL